MPTNRNAMKKVFEKIVEGILTCSGYITSITILLIVAFLFTEAFGLFNNKVIEDGYVLVLNKENEIGKLSSREIFSMRKSLIGKKWEEKICL